MDTNMFLDGPRSASNILLVSDSRTQLDLMKLILSDLSTVITADSGLAAEQLAREQRPDLIVSDVVMPEVDGIELCRRLKSGAATKNIPILLVTALRFDDAGITEAMNAGADDYLEINAPRGLLRKKAERLISQAAEKRAREMAEARYRSLIESLPAIIYIAQAKPPYGPIYVSPGIETLGYSVDEWHSQPDLWVRVLHPDDRERVLKETEVAWATHRQTQYEYRVIARDGTVRWWVDRGRFLENEWGAGEYWQGIIVDVTDMKGLEQQLRHADKLSSLGQLVAGIAHELSNPLTAVIGFSQLLQLQSNMSGEAAHKLGIIEREAERARRILGNLLSFVRASTPQRTEVKINQLLESTLELREYEMKANNIVTDRDFEALPSVLGDAQQLQQVFLNLIVNAEQAMVESVRSGTVKISTRVRGSNGDRRVQIVVADTGPGIRPEHIRKVFEPFFTTKEAGKGTGLGLSVSNAIIKEHGGSMSVENRAEGGAMFTIELPSLTTFRAG